MAISLKDYRKAFYKMSVRNKIEISFENSNPSIARFIMHKNHDKYIQIYGSSCEPLAIDVNSKMAFGVIRYGENIIGVFPADGNGELIGDLGEITLPRKVEDSLKLFNVRR